MSNVKLSAERTPHDLGRFVFTCGDIGKLKIIDSTPVMAGDSYECDMVGSMRLSPLRRGLAIDSKTDICTFYIPHRHIYGEDWINFMHAGPDAKPLPSSPIPYSEPWASAFLGTGVNTSHHHVPKWLVEGYCRIYDNYFCSPELLDQKGEWLNRDLTQWSENDLRNGQSICHLKNIWTAPLPLRTAMEYKIPVGGEIDLMGMQQAYAALHTKQERDFFMQRYRDVMQSFGGSTSYDGDQRPHMLMRSEFWASGYDVDGTDTSSLGQFAGRVQQSYNHRVPRFYVPEHGSIITVMVTRFPPIHEKAIPYYIGSPNHIYQDIAGDAAIDNNMAPRVVSFDKIFSEGSTTAGLKLPHGQWFRSVPDHVDPHYSALDGFPFLTVPPADNWDAAVVKAGHYDRCFQTMQLRHWNSQLKTNVTVHRSIPDARASILTNA